MPYKERIKTGEARNRKRCQYKVINWSDYNQSLKKRGMISLYFPEGDIKAQFVNETPYVEGISGRLITYKPAYIEVIYMLYRLFGWGQRQITGYFEDIWNTKGLDISVPSFGHLCDLFKEVPVSVKQYCKGIRKRIDNGEKVSIIVDSTGLRFNKASYWYETKYQKPCNRALFGRVRVFVI